MGSICNSFRFVA